MNSIHQGTQSKLLGIIVVATILGASPNIQAGEWRITPRVTKQETFSDNINQASSSAAHSDYVTQITPGLGVTGTGAKLSLNFDYSADLLHYLHGTSDNSTNHRLQATSNAEILDQLLFLDFKATAGQQNTNNSGTLVTDNLTVSDNKSNFLTYDISPFLRHHLGGYAEAVSRYRHQQTYNDGSLDTEVDTLSLEVFSGRRFGRLPWTLSIENREFSNSDGTSTTFRRVDSSVSYNYTRRYGVRLNIGYEDNDIISSVGNADGVTWGVTGTWTPSQRTNLEAGYDHRFFGTNFNIAGTHRMRRAIFNVSYAVDATTSASEQLESNLFPLLDAFGEQIQNPGVNDTPIPINRASISNNVIISTSFNAGLNMQGRRSNFGISIFNTERDFGSRADSEKVYGVNASASRTLSRKNSANIGFDWQTNEQSDNIDDTQWSFNVGYSHRFNADISTTFSYRHAEGSSDGIGNNDFKENRVSANLNWLF